MIVLSSCPVRSSASKNIPTPSSTAAIMHARSRTSSCPPEWMALWSICAFSDFLSSKASAHAGLLFTISAGVSTFGPHGEDAVAVEVLVARGGAIALHGESAIGGLLGVRVHRLVREEERPR